jgi:hypothetical protein
MSCSTALALVDSPIGTSILSLLFDFEHHRISLHSFVIGSIPPTGSRIMPVIDELRVMKTLKGEEINIID